MDFDREEKRLLTALWIDHHGRDRLIGADELAASYGVKPLERWLESFAATLEAKGWVTVYRSKTSIALALKPEGYCHGLAAALDLTGGTAIEVQFDRKEILGDGSIPEDIPGGPGWKYFTYENVEGRTASAKPTRAPMAVVTFDQDDGDHRTIGRALDEAILSIEGDNELIGKEHAVARLRNAASLWSGASIRIVELRVGVLMAIDDVCEMASGAYYAGALAALRSLVRAFARDKLHIDLNGVL